ncbi:hypothetical protein KQX54_010992 [Cotesia glomerata]|uniref:Uncharacterized protein n=1 Tax=Cotesia glomerata TaxID=32391 RepID=A0AAV7IS52_COTGL|nr:hypothetical protein KQX54_010992 [Cotesia glomerata]
MALTRLYSSKRQRCYQQSFVNLKWLADGLAGENILSWGVGRIFDVPFQYQSEDSGSRAVKAISPSASDRGASFSRLGRQDDVDSSHSSYRL